MVNENDFHLGFAVFPGIGPSKFELLLKKFGSAENAWNQTQKNLLEILGEKLTGEFIDFREKFNAEKYAEELEEKEIGFVTLVDEEYPELLKNMASFPVIPDSIRQLSPQWGNSEIDSRFLGNDKQEEIASPAMRDRNDGFALKQSSNLKSPLVLFYKGNKSLFQNTKTIGIVGTRSISEYGKQVTQMLARDLTQQGFVIISGLALGVDGVAHLTCLESNGKTIAVLGSGVDICTPSIHQKLYDRILQEDGLIVSTVPPGEQPNKGSFPARNKIIAGLSLGVILTEGTADSGALYTADFAKDMGRPIFAVPGPITSRLSAATTKLLKNNAILVTSAGDVVDTLNYASSEVKSLKSPSSSSSARTVEGDNPVEQEILDILQNESQHFNEIVRTLGKSSQETGSILSIMELKGLLHQSSDGKYSL